MNFASVAFLEVVYDAHFFQFKKFEMFLFGFSSVFAVAQAETVCNGPDYSPLGCFTDRPPFGGLGSGRRGMLPDPIREVQPMFFLSNILGSDMLIDWENPSLSRFETNKPVVAQGSDCK